MNHTCLKCGDIATHGSIETGGKPIYCPCHAPWDMIDLRPNCRVKDCKKKISTQGLCVKHYALSKK